MALQDRLPGARVVYCSATGVSDLKQMAYADRLGLWGPGTNFVSFDVFRSSLERRGVGAMEMLALEMKQAGCFVARTLSWKGAEFESLRLPLSPHQVQIYDQSVTLWNLVKTEIKSALARPDMNGTPKTMWSQYWSAYQRFTKELAICAKVQEVVKDAKKQLESGRSVVIGLQTTGESSTQASLGELQSKLLAAGRKPLPEMEDVPLPGLLSTAAAIMTGFIRKHYPVAPLPQELLPVPSVPRDGFSTDLERNTHRATVDYNEQIRRRGPPTPMPELLAVRERLLRAVENIPLPPAPLDDLIDRLGGVEDVAEMTGRSCRILRRPSSTGGSRFGFVRRVSVPKENRKGLSLPVSEEEADRLNIVSFMFHN